MKKIFLTSILYSVCIIAFSQAKVYDGKLIVGTAVSELIGKDISDLQLINLKGETIAMNSFKGKYLYVDFWFTGCKPCIAEVPSARALEDKLQNKDIVFVNISFDLSQDEWKESVKKFEIAGENLWVGSIEKRDVWTAEYNMMVFPRYWIVNPDGIILHPDAERPSKYLQIEELLERDIETVSNIR